MVLLGDGDAVQRKPRFESDQQLVEVDERGDRDLGCANLKASAEDGVELPGRKHRDDARSQLDMHELIRCAPLTLDASRSLPEQWMPAIMDNDILPDMGTMTARLPSGDATGPSAAQIPAGSAPPCSTR